MTYQDIYHARMNRYGSNGPMRIEKGRQENFERFLKSSPHYATFNYKDRIVECVFEPQQQNETKTIMHLLCRVGEEFNAGDIVDIQYTRYNANGTTTTISERYMFWYWTERRDSGYNRWAMLAVNLQFSYLNEDGTVYNNEGYLYGQEDNMLKNELKSRSRSATLYLENLKLDFIVMPTDVHLQVNSYITVNASGITRNYRVTGFDPVSTPGIMYVSMDPTLERDLTPAPERQPGDDPNDFFWLGDVDAET